MPDSESVRSESAGPVPVAEHAGSGRGTRRIGDRACGEGNRSRSRQPPAPAPSASFPLRLAACGGWRKLAPVVEGGLVRASFLTPLPEAPSALPTKNLSRRNGPANGIRLCLSAPLPVSLHPSLSHTSRHANAECVLYHGHARGRADPDVGDAD